MKLLHALCAVLLLASCRKFIEVDIPKSRISSENVYSGDVTATSVLTGLYINISREDASGTRRLRAVPYRTCLLADELKLIYLGDGNRYSWYVNNLSAELDPPEFWSDLYSEIGVVNAALEGLAASKSLTTAVKKQLQGEAYFMRAFYFFYLNRLYGRIALPLTTDYTVNNTMGRSDSTAIFRQMIDDLQQARELLSADFLDGTLLRTTTERVRPTRWAASALLARVYLYAKDYANAEKAATEVIEHTGLFRLTIPEETFLKNNREAIFQLQELGTGDRNNPVEGREYIIREGSEAQYLRQTVSDGLLQSFEAGDLRKAQWIGSAVASDGKRYYFPYKYKVSEWDLQPQKEYCTLFRLAELFLIRAEARAWLGDPTGAEDDLFAVRERAGLGRLPFSDPQAFTDAVLAERRVELFTEWSHRWFDLRRTGKLDAVMQVAAPIKGATWESYKALLPIPFSALRDNLTLAGDQNPGYH